MEYIVCQQPFRRIVCCNQTWPGQNQLPVIIKKYGLWKLEIPISAYKIGEQISSILFDSTTLIWLNIINWSVDTNNPELIYFQIEFHHNISSNIWGFRFTLPISPTLIMRKGVFYLSILIKSEVWSICHCLRLNHETSECAVCLSILWKYSLNTHITRQVENRGIFC